MEIQITAIKFETINGKKTGKSFSFKADPKKLAKRGELDAVRCAIGKSIRWYYRERQAESAHLRGLA